MAYDVRFTREAFKDAKKLPPKLKQKLRDIVVNQIAQDPYSGKKLVGDLAGFFSLWLTYKDRIVYSVDEHSKTVFIHRARTHYGE